jgi:hypothetical protein
MKSIGRMLAILSLWLSGEQAVSADAWYTGTLLAQPGINTPKGQFVVSPYTLQTHSLGTYNQHGDKESEPMFRSVNPVMQFAYGFTNRFDALLLFQYQENSTLGYHASDVGDPQVLLGYQVYASPRNTFFSPSLRVYVQETFPLGRFDRASEKKNLVEITGLGAWQTQFGVNFESLQPLWNDHYLHSVLTLSVNMAPPVFVDGPNAYGGGVDSRGWAHPGTEYLNIWANEFTMTQHWVLSLECAWLYSDSNAYRGYPGRAATGHRAKIDRSPGYQVSVLPGIEYNFNENLGLLFSTWYTPLGRNTSRFTSAFVLLTYSIS